MSSVTWSTGLLSLLHAPLTPANYRFVNQWVLREHVSGDLYGGSMYGNNPFFTTAGAGGTVGPFKAGDYPRVPASVSPAANRAGVALYPNLAVGVVANAYHIATEYPTVAAALRSGDPSSFAGNPRFQQELTRWSGAGYSGFQSIAAPSGPVGPKFSSGDFKREIAGIAQGSDPFKGAPQSVGSAAARAANAVPGVKQAEAVAGFVGKLTNASYILRGLQVVGGGLLVGVGAVLLARQVALAADVPAPGPVAAAASAVE